MRLFLSQYCRPQARSHSRSLLQRPMPVLMGRVPGIGRAGSFGALKEGWKQKTQCLSNVPEIRVENDPVTTDACPRHPSTDEAEASRVG